MRIFAGDKVRSMMEWLGMEKGVAIESKTVSRQIERAQKAVEARNFETRKHVLKYDDVMNRQRETIYGLASPVDVRTGASRISAWRQRASRETCFTI